MDTLAKPAGIAEVRERNQYGVKVLVPVNDWAQLACQLAGTKTLTRPAVDTLARFGVTVYVLPEAGRVL